MTEEWKEFSPLVELESDSLNEVQEELVAGGEALQHLLTVEHPNADAVRTSIQAIKDDLDFEGISNTWIVDCGHASFRYYGENMHVWSDVREVCMDLLSTGAFGKFQELCDLYVFDTDGDENL